jgi:HK97 family phage major capsid protein
MEKEIKEVTEEQLKTIVSETAKEALIALKSEIIAELKSGLPEVKQVETTESKLEIAGKFVKDLCMGKVEQKVESPIDSSTGSFGYTIPTELANSILEKRDKLSKMRKIAFKFNLAGPFQLPTEGTGVTSYWVAENEEITDSSPTIEKTELSDHYLAARVLMPRQLL